ncbi:hypothetical protein [Flavobacterium phage FLiP]|uniref:Uncharacterized protein n=1 Tax=Flavobacterium phage FLiP TaxID=2023716 RepID=A0A222NP89_9VIRU|nr:hypothetical protein HOR88_gp02 [Flavobacterium phage FLiP]ASQ41225.1 hypothetical protein [Flavobacterium phage FLiP]
MTKKIMLRAEQLFIESDPQYSTRYLDIASDYRLKMEILFNEMNISCIVPDVLGLLPEFVKYTFRSTDSEWNFIVDYYFNL